MVNPSLETFPNLTRGGYPITSPPNQSYNCIAYATGDTENWWWPLPENVPEVYWPAGVSREETLLSFQDLFASLGFLECEGEDLESGFEKIALFANEHGFPLHAVRQLTSGRWTSKLGECEDIEHALYDLEGEAYGKVVLTMKRPC